MSHIVELCPLTKLDGGLKKLHTADDESMDWRSSYGTQSAVHTPTAKCPMLIICYYWPEWPQGLEQFS